MTLPKLAAAREGRWHSLVYVDIPRTRALVEVASKLCAGDADQAHCSVSRPFALFTHQVDAFVERLRTELRLCRPFVLSVLAETVELRNDGDHRVFKALRVPASRGLVNLVAAVDRTLEAFGRDPYFDQPVFHVTVAIDHDDTPPTKRAKTDEIDDLDDDAGDLSFDVTYVVCKCGHRHFQLELL
ncbi:hypothetical protein CTAYLR_007644 [Chrysophaeum taylorii]|uniref:U6 snRNA phosphodiesterase 1 n=1 Tax=Chrysophaeum taylorii TaxID=2483200 RepID=A0AAD7U5G5_9STRA|nr:hypothetical protein CTAYLR_007644 [Chrysophaeum taylorii]